MITTFILPISAKGKPRMTKRDVWKKRECVVEYRAWCDKIREALKIHGIEIPETAYKLTWKAFIQFPKSYSAKDRLRLAGMIHQVKPDRDNIDKALMDIFFKDDQRIAIGSQIKLWEDVFGPRIEVEIHY